MSPSKAELLFLCLGKQMSLIFPGNSWLHQVCVRITHPADIGNRSISSVGTGKNRCRLSLINGYTGGVGQWERTASPSLHAVQVTACSTHGLLSLTLSFWGTEPTGKRSVLRPPVFGNCLETKWIKDSLYSILNKFPDKSRMNYSWEAEWDQV